MWNRLFRARPLRKLSNGKSIIEALESRTLLSGTESATAQLALVSTSGTSADPVYHYDITLTDTGTTNLGTFWFGWVPGEDFLPSVPLSETSPTGWGNAAGTSSTPVVTGGHDSSDGSAIQWVAQSTGAALTPGQSLSGFDFSSPDSLAALNGASPTHSPTPVLTSFVYIGAPETDPGDQFVVTEASPAATSTLAPTIGKSTIPSPVVGGTKLNAVVSVSVKNQTAATIKGKTTVELFATTDGAIDSSATLVGSVIRSLDVGTGDSVVVPVKVSSALSGLSAGGYTLLARTIDPSAHTTDSTTGPTVQVAEPVIALSESFARLTLPASVAPGAKTKASAVLEITNDGNIESSGATKISLYASMDGSVDGTATLIQSITKTLHIGLGKSVVESLAIKTFPAVAAGQYFIVAQVTDPHQETTSAIAATKVTVS
jgi:hypothetical protein